MSPIEEQQLRHDREFDDLRLRIGHSANGLAMALVVTTVGGSFAAIVINPNPTVILVSIGALVSLRTMVMRMMLFSLQRERKESEPLPDSEKGSSRDAFPARLRDFLTPLSRVRHD